MKPSRLLFLCAILFTALAFFLFNAREQPEGKPSYGSDAGAEASHSSVIPEDSSESSLKETTRHSSVSQPEEVSSLASLVSGSTKPGGWYEDALSGSLTVLQSFSPDESPNVTYVRTQLKHPWIRIETRETKVNGQLVEHWDAAVGDHLILRKRPEVSEDELRQVLGEVSARIISELGVANTYLVGLDVVEGEDVLEQTRSALSAMDDFVDLVESDALIASSGSPETQPALLEGRQWPLHNTGAGGGLTGSDIDALAGWSVSNDASGIIVAVVDTGIDYFHEDLISNIWVNFGEIPDNGVDDDGNGHIDDVYGIDAYNNDKDPADDNGHGTHCAGIIGADGFNEIGITGVAPRVQIMALKFLSANGLGYTSDALEVLSYAKDNGAQVLNLSWGNRAYSGLLFELLQSCEDAGMIAVAAAGNDADNIDNRPVYPASYDLVGLLAVSSVDDYDRLSGFSNYGVGTVKVAAPGTNILSTWIGPGSPYRELSGTSMAAPHVAGVVALLRAAFPSDLPQESLFRLLNGCEQLEGLEPSVELGRRLNLNGALTAGKIVRNDTVEGAYVADLHASRWVESNLHGKTELGDESRPASVWYRWVPPSSGNALIQFSASAGTYFDVLRQNGSESVMILEEKQNGNYTFEATENAGYSIVVYGERSDFTIEVSIPPVNDNRDDASPIAGRQWSRAGANLGATSEPGEANIGYGAERSVWWRWTAPESGAIRIDTTGSDFDTLLSVFSENPLEGVFQGDKPEITFVIDVSGSTRDSFGGSFINDLNGDGRSNTILDGEIAAVSNLVKHINSSAIADSNTVRIVVFEGGAFLLDLNPVDSGVQELTPSTADLNANGRLDIIEALEGLVAGGGTNYRAALAKAESEFVDIASDSTANMVFFSDGKPTGGGAYTDVVQRLRNKGTFIRAFGAGSNASLGALILIDPIARIYSTEDELGQMISGALAFNDDAWPKLTSEVNLAVEGGKTYYIKVSGYDGESGTINLNGTMYDGLEILSQPESKSIEYGSGHLLQAKVRGVAPLAYQWFLNGEAIEGADRASYYIEEANGESAGDYHLMVSNTFDYLTTDSASISFYRDPPEIVAAPYSQKVVVGADVSLEVDAVGTAPLSYQWYFKGEPLLGAETNVYQINAFSEDEVGNYFVAVSNAAGEARSIPATLNLSSAPFESWRLRNASGPILQPEATLGHGDFFYVFDGDRVVRTRDGIEWQDVSLPIEASSLSLNGEIRSVFVQNGMIVVDYFKWNRSNYFTSTDGLSWALLDTPTGSEDLREYNGVWYLNGFENSKHVFLQSNDLLHWETVDLLDPYHEFTLVERGSEWRYLVDGQPNSSWYVYDSFSGSWPRGDAELGYGEGDEATVIPYLATPTKAYFQLPFKKDAGHTSLDIRGRIKYDTTATLRFGYNTLFSDSSSDASDPQGDWVTIPLNESVSLNGSGRQPPFSVEIGKGGGDTSMSFDLELLASSHVGLFPAVTGNDRVIVLKRSGEVYVSFDGVNWIEHVTTGISDPASNVNHVPFTGSPRFLLGRFIGWDDVSHTVFLSDDGINWESYPYPYVDLLRLSGSTTSTRVPLGSAGSLIEFDGQLVMSMNTGPSDSYILTSSDFLNWTSIRVDRGEGAYPAESMGQLTTNGSHLFTHFQNTEIYGASADYGIFGSLGAIAIPEPYRKLDVSRLRIIDGNFVTFSDDYADSARISADTEDWKSFLSGSKDGVFHAGAYYALQRRYDGKNWIRKDTAVVGNSAIDWSNEGETGLIAWPFTWEPWTLVHFNGRFIAAGWRGGIATSTDSVNWELRQASSDSLGTILHSEVLNGKWFGMTDDGTVVTSDNGVDFTRTTLSANPVRGPFFGGLAAAAYGNGVYLICVENDDVAEMYRSTDAINWTRVNPGSGDGPTGVAFGDGWFIAVAGEEIYFSTDGVNWDAGSLSEGGGHHVVYHMGSFWICNNEGVFWSTRVEDLPELPTIELNTLDDTYLINSTVRVEANIAIGDASFSRLQFFLDGEMVYDTTDSAFIWEKADLAPGYHEFVFKAYDADGRLTIHKTGITIVFSENANVMPGAILHASRFFRGKDGIFYGLGDEKRSSSNYGGYLARSVDGRNWKQVKSVSDLPDLSQLVDFVELDNGLKLIRDSSNNLITSRDGLNWQPLGEVGLTGRLFSNGETAFMMDRMVDGNSIGFSTDGINWQEGVISRSGGSSSSIDWLVTSVEYWNGRFVAFGYQNGAIAVSPDGINWVAGNPAPAFGRDSRLVAGGSYLVSFSAISGYTSYPDFQPIYGMTAYFSEDGLNWTPVSEKTDKEFRNLQSVNGVFYGADQAGFWRSEDLTDWEFISEIDASNEFLNEAELYETSDGFLALESESTTLGQVRALAVTSDLVDWELLQDYPLRRYTDPILEGLSYDGQNFVANVGTGLLRSENGRNWVDMRIDLIDEILSVENLAALWIVAGYAPDSDTIRVLWSSDLENWSYSDVYEQTRNSNSTCTLRYLNGAWILVDRDNVYRSTDLIDWTQVPPLAEMPFSEGFDNILSAKIMGDRFVLFHDNGFFSSTDGLEWNFIYSYNYHPNVNFDTWAPRMLRYVDGYYVYPSEPGTSGPTATHARSLDLTSWEEVPGFQELIQLPWASIGDIGLAYFRPFPTSYDNQYDTYITFDKGASYTVIPTNYAVQDIVATDDAFYVCRSYMINELSLVDLAVENTTVSYEGTLGADVPITVAFDLRNLGFVTYDRAGALKISVVLSESESLDMGSSEVLFETTLESPLDAGESMQFTQQVYVPRDLAVGDFHLGVFVDSTDQLAELNEENNIYFSPESLVDIPGVILTVNQAEGGSVLSGSSIPGALTLSGKDSGLSAISGAMELPYNQQLNLQAKPNKNYAFGGWVEYPGQGEYPLNLNLTTDLTLTPIFRKLISVSVFTQGKGSIETIPLNTSDLTSGENVSLTAIPDDGWTFLKWEGDLNSTNSSVNLTANSSHQIRAIFYRNVMRFEDWKSDQFTVYETPNASVSGVEVDADGDGYSNLHEYFFRTNSKNPDDRPSINIRFHENSVSFEFETDPRISDYEAVIYSSPDLNTWRSETPVEDRTTHQSFDHADRHLSAPVDREENPRYFYRLKIDPKE
jgi:subtilisin family serine protease